jgi:uncharacterized protein YybS (DUF2232 family)
VSGGIKSIFGESKGYQHIILFGLIITIPGFQSTLFGLIYFLIPLVVLFYLYKWENGLKYVLGGIVLGGIASAILDSLGTLLVTITFIPPGYILAEAAFQGNTPARSGIKAAVTLIGCWILILIGFSMVTGVNPVSDFIASMDQGVEEALRYYKQSDNVDPETITLIEHSFYQMKAVFPKVIPSIITGFALLTIWFTMVTGNSLIRRFLGYKPWINHRLWELPGTLVWILIGSTIITLMPIGVIRLIGINALIVFSFIYFFQGFSIFVFFMHKWNVPLLLRTFFYGMMLFQSFGTVLLLVVGIGDVWFDLRRLHKNDDNEKSDEDNHSKR